MRLLGQVCYPDVPLKRSEQRWAGFDTPEWPTSILSLASPRGPAERDWDSVQGAAPTRGAAWIASACLAP